MKKSLFRLGIIALIIQLLTISKVFATDSFRVRFENELSVKAGEQIEVPIIIDNIHFEDSVQKGILAFSCKLDYDTDVFELIGTDKGESTEYIHFSENVEPYISRCVFVPETKGLVIEIGQSALENGEKYIDKYTKIASITLKAKEDSISGRYVIAITDVEGGNVETSVDVVGVASTIYIDGIEKEDGSKPEVNSEKRNIGTITDIDEKGLKVEFKKSEDGTKLIINVDNVNGIEVEKVVLDGEELKGENGSFIADVESGKVYKALFYSEDGNLIGIQMVTIDELEVQNIDSSSASSKAKEVKGYASESGEDESEQKAVKDVIKNVFTGDNIIFWTGLVLALVACFYVAVALKKRSNK